MKIVQAQIDHLRAVASLFDQYRVFYGAASNLNAAHAFLQARLQHGDSVILVAQDGDRLVGFTQLYPSFSSVAMQRIWILNDLFVEPSSRNQGIAKQLLQAAEAYAKDTHAIRIVLATQISNVLAQSLYESLGYRKDEAFYHYVLPLG
ncbi:N-acetyltransferase family protein [Leptolyngbya sp. AN02str]|uniref:GNAT family N-acetyltransferase n=1 Tax=Leptolyngbya sp. AN02str TaxID=3423363 RepID=UPI003D31318A